MTNKIMYTSDGAMCNVILTDNDRLHIVQYYDDGWNEVYEGKLYNTPPAKKYHKKIELLRKKKLQLQRECDNLAAERDRILGELNMAKLVREAGDKK